MSAPHPSTSRRTFCTGLSAVAATRLLRAQQPPSEPTSRPDVAAMDRQRILSAADHLLSQPVTPLSLPHSSGDATEFTSEPEDETASVPSPSPHRDAALAFTLAVPALTAAWLLTRTSDPAQAARFATHAADHLRAWFVTPATRMEPSLNHASAGHPEGILDTSGFAEIAVALPFLLHAGAISSTDPAVSSTDPAVSSTDPAISSTDPAVSPTETALSRADAAAIQAWFTTFLTWLTTSRLAGLARDRKDHVGSSWLLQAAAYARLTANDTTLAQLRHQFKTVTLRANILADGTFPHELTTPNPYRNSLFNLDLLAGACDQLSTRFENLWDYQLQDGPGIRVAIARLFPSIENRAAWPYRADAHLFHDLPCRRPALLLAARAYGRPEYATLWRSLNPDPTNPAILRTFPIRQPLLWVTRPPRGPLFLSEPTTP